MEYHCWHMYVDYSSQLNRIIELLPKREPIPSWVVGLIGVVVGAVLQRVIAWMDKSSKHRTIKRAITEEIGKNFRILSIFDNQNQTERMTEPFGNRVTITTQRYEAIKHDFSFTEMKEAGAIDEIYEILMDFGNSPVITRESVKSVLQALEYYEPMLHFKAK